MTSHAEFGPRTTGAEAAKAFAGRIAGKAVVITGVSPKSLGESLAMSLAPHAPALLILASRSLDKIQAVSAAVTAAAAAAATGDDKQKLHPLKVAAVELDLSSQQSVRAAAARIQEIVQSQGEGRGIDILYNNAGINVPSRQLSPEGIELQFATNHVGPFLLTNLLMPLLVRGSAGGGGRVVVTSSEGHRVSPVRFSDYNLAKDPRRVEELEAGDRPRHGLPEGILRGDGEYESWIAYAQSKTANVLFGLSIGLVWGGQGVRGVSLHPGTIWTNIVRELSEEAVKNLVSSIQEWKTLEQGAATLVVAGLDPALSDYPGSALYLDDCQLKRPSKWAADPAKAERLWRLSEDLVGEKFGPSLGEQGSRL